MSHTLQLQCGCVVYVACNPLTAVAHTRVVERRGTECRVRKHEVGAHLHLWEILPERAHAEMLRGDAEIRWP
jgi:hypothetical protein